MFKKVLESLSKSLMGAKPPAKPKAKEAPAGKSSGGRSGSLLEKVAKQKMMAPSAPAPTPEDMCGVTPKMSKDEIRAQLRLLYRRYNRGASSLDAKVRSEADRMLDAIVALREKHFGEI